MADSLSVSFRYTKEDILNVVIESLGFDIKRCWLMLFGILLLLCVAGYFVLIKVYMVTILFVLFALAFVPVYIFIAYMNLSSALGVLTDCVYTIEKNQSLKEKCYQHFSFLFP